MSVIDRAAIMARPPDPAAAGVPVVTLAAIPKILLMGGLMYAGGKLAEAAWTEGKKLMSGGSEEPSEPDEVENPEDDEPEDEDLDEEDEPEDEDDDPDPEEEEIERKIDDFYDHPDEDE